MNIRNTVSIAIKAIWVNKVRSFLTMLGVIIGVSSVVMLISIGKGLEHYITGQFEALGTNNVYVMPGQVFNGQGGFDPESRINAIANNPLDMRDVNSIKKMTQYVEIASPMHSGSKKISFQDESVQGSTVGTTYRMGEILNLEFAQGSFFSKAEEQGADKVVVLGANIAEDLFGEADALGKKVLVGSQNFRVVGVTQEKGGSFGGPSFDDYVYMPIEAAFKLYDNDEVAEIGVKVKDKDLMTEAIAAIERELLKRHDEEDFSVIDQAEILDVINDILGVLTVGLGGIAAISLVVGGIGIMNIMLVSVTERTREIGLRKALGATPNTILAQFLFEAAFLSIIGGMIGLAVAYGGSLLLQKYFPAKVTLDAVLLAFGVSTVVGLVFGAAPARRASKLSPIEALRYE